MVALVIFLTPFLLSFRQALLGRQVSEQVVIPAVKLSQAQSVRYAAFQRRERAEAPIVVTYRDIRPSRAGQESRPDTVTTATFSTHLAMLEAAGYSTLSAEQLTRYLDGEPVPARSIVLAFDGGLQGSWVYVDRMLRRHGFRGMAFIPTSKIGAQRSRHLTWSELRRMNASGRWDIQTQGPDPDATVPMAANGQPGGFYSVRAWLHDMRRRESPRELRRRIRRTLTNANAAFARHGLPAPRFLAGIPLDPAVRQEIADLYRAVMVDSELPSSVSRRDLTGPSVDRLAVRRATTAAQLFRQLALMAALNVATRSPARDPQRWFIDWNREGELRFTAGGVVFDSSSPGRLEARYAPQASEDWTDYAVQVDVDGLRRSDTASTAGLMVLDGSRYECDVRVSSARMDLFCPARGLFRREELRPRSNHRLDVRVSRQWLVVRVDGSSMHRLRLPAGQAAAGGFGLSIYRARADVAAPRFHRLRLIRLPDGAGSEGLDGAPQGGAQPSDQLGERGTQAG